jgi:hypothetical protein
MLGCLAGVSGERQEAVDCKDRFEGFVHQAPEVGACPGLYGSSQEGLRQLQSTREVQRQERRSVATDCSGVVVIHVASIGG